MTRPLVLIPSSKAKQEGGGDLPYRDSSAMRRGPLAGPRCEVLEALQVAAEELDDAGIMRLCGVRSEHVDAHREHLRTIGTEPTLPAHRRYTGVIHRFAGFDEVEPTRTGTDVAVFTGLLGIALADDPVPSYRLEVTGRVPGLGVLGTWWRPRLGEHLRELGASRRVWDLLPGEFARLWPTSERGDLEVVTVRFERPDGRAAPSASAKVAKGQLLGLLLEEPATTPEALVSGQPLEGWKFLRRERDLAAVQTS
jgi:uncharacterized protein